ncbi:MAG: prolipoprotein diacylglyceryl transferase [Clostridia bacterium]|nr:prolipoprotein diacylglyceryl transferase [Clostridia bacterium]
MTYDVTIFGIDITLKPIAFSLSLFGRQWDVYWYGILIALGFFLAIVYGWTNAKRFGIDKDKMLDVVLVAAPVAIFCARLYYVIFDGVKCESIADFFGFGESSGVAGIAIYGAVIGAFVSGGLMCKLKKIKITDMFDLGALGFLIGQGIGRWGNFVNQEAYGSFTNSSFWGMESNKTIADMGEGLVHPCFLYESIWCILGFFIIHKLSKKRKFSGEVFLMYCAWYGFGRGFIEILRTDSLMWGNIKISCLLAFLLCAASVTAIIVIRNKMKPEKEYVSVFSENMEEENETD